MTDGDFFEVLVGWASDDYGDRLMLRMQGAQRGTSDATQIAEQRYMLTKEQAVLLANFLFRVSGHTAPTPSRRPFWRRIFG